MTRLLWDQSGTRFYEDGVDRGVLYLPDGSGIPWNGLTSVTESVNGASASPVYFDGVKFADILVLGNYGATLRSYTYPDEFLQFEGVQDGGNGLFIGNQQPERFGLSYRTRINNDNFDDGYKIHVVYNLRATPSDKSYQTLSPDNGPIEFEWTVTSTPIELPGYRPTAHLIFDTRQMGELLVKDIEDALYGDGSNDARLPSISTLTSFVGEWVIIRIVENIDGTWTATGPSNLISMLDATTFQIIQANAVYLDVNTYSIGNLTY